MIILVTGSCGFIGSHVCEKLLNNYPNYKIYGIDNLNNFIYSTEQKIENKNILCKYSNYNHIENDIMNGNYIIDIKPNIIIHLADYGNVDKSLTQPNDYINNNVNVTTKLLYEISFFKKMPLFIYGSCSCVYGKNRKVPFNENDTLNNIISLYGLSKKMCEDTVELYYKMYRIKAIGLRFFSVYGPRMRPDMAIHKFLTSLIENKPIKMHGDGSTLRDYTYIDDVVKGIINSLHFVNCKNGLHTIYNIGSSNPLKLIDLIYKCENITIKKTTIIVNSSMNDDLKITYADISKARNEINYNPKISMEEGLLNTYLWLINKNNYKNKQNMIIYNKIKEDAINELKNDLLFDEINDDSTDKLDTIIQTKNDVSNNISIHNYLNCKII